MCALWDQIRSPVNIFFDPRDIFLRIAELMMQPIDNKNVKHRGEFAAVPREISPRDEVSRGTREAVAERLRQARHSMGLTQKEAAERANQMPLPSYKGCEAAKKIPGGEAIQGLMKLGISANWLLSGEGPMLLVNTQAQTISPREAALIDTARFGLAQPDASALPASALDPARLRLAIETVEEGLAATQRTMTPEKKAELVTAVYDLFADDTSAQAKGKVLRLVKLAA